MRFESLEKRQLLAAELSVLTADGQYDLTQGSEAGTVAVELVVELDQTNQTGSAITFDLEDLGTGTATAGVDYIAIPAGAQIAVPNNQQSAIFRIDVLNDFLIEPTEILNLRISNPSDPSVQIGTGTVAATIADDDDAGVTITGANNLSITEAGQTDTYTIALDTIPTGAVEITATADDQTQISVDGVNFSSTQILSLTDMTPQTITVRAINAAVFDGGYNGTVTHAITGVVVDPNYPDVTFEDLYTQTGTDPTFQELIDSGALPTGQQSRNGITGSTIDVNNSIVEQGVHANTPIHQGINIHTLAHSVIPRRDFDRWSRWYQEDGNTQVFRVFEGEENVRNSRALAARIESHSNGWQTGVWNDFSARYTILKPESMSIFQSFQLSGEWSVHLGMTADGGVNFTHRRANGGGQLTIPLAENMIGKSFDVRIRENGLDYEVYFNGELKGRGQYEKPDSVFQFRWGTYRGSRPMNNDSLIFVTGASIQANTSEPVGLVPYRPATTSLSIDSVTANVIDNDVQLQTAFVDQTVQDGTRILVEEFDLGGQDVAYFDTTAGNLGGQARPDDDVDLYAGSIVLGNVANGEWLEFTRDVVPGVYDIDVRAWSNNNNAKAVRISIAADASQPFTELGSIAIPNTNNDRISQTIKGIDLTAWGGQDRVIRVDFDGGALGYDWIEFKGQLDFGDAPFSTLVADDGARHIATGLGLGANRDTEVDGAASMDANGDGDDEDGVLFGGISTGGNMAALNVNLSGELSGEMQGKIDAWIDFDRDGVWESWEKIVDSVLVDQQMQTLNYALPSSSSSNLPGGLTPGDTFARIRLSSAGGLGPTGLANDGEVEDYLVSIVKPPTVESITINEGALQRSSLDSVRVTFDQLVEIDTDGGTPFQLVDIDSGEAVAIEAPVIGQSDVQTIVDFTFVSSGSYVTDFGSLRDGDYQLRINPALVTSSGVQLDGDRDGTAGDAYVTNASDGLFRKYGDIDGDGGVGLTDFAAFRATFGKPDSDPEFLSGLDSDGDGEIGLTDFADFRASFGN